MVAVAATGGRSFSFGYSPLLHHNTISPQKTLHFLSPTSGSALSSKRRSFISDMTPISSKEVTPFMEEYDDDDMSIEDFMGVAESLVNGSADNGPPRWFSPLGCSSVASNCPLLLYLPGIDGTGAGLALQQKRLGKFFDIWCMHIPVTDRTPFLGLVNMVEETIKRERNRCPNKPIYIVGESLGACIALTVAARNPDIDLALILANPATSFDKSPLQALVPFLEIVPDQVQLNYPFLMSLLRGDSFMGLRGILEKLGLAPQQTVDELSRVDVLTMFSYISVMADILPKKTLLWKLQILQSASAYTNSKLHAVKTPHILLLISGKDRLLPVSATDISRLYRALPEFDIRNFAENGHLLFLEDGVNLLTIIKATCFYRRGKNIDFVTDYLPLTQSEYTSVVYESTKLFCEITSPVMLSTLEDGTIVKGLSGIPSEGPTLYVGYHMLLGVDILPLFNQVLLERNILLRGIAHPMFFEKYKEGSPIDQSTFDIFRIMGAVPVSGSNLFNLLKHNCNVLLYPGGAREVLHRKGEQYKLFWPEEAEFVRMAARFGAKIIPFGVVGEDDIGEVSPLSAQVFVDYDDLMKISFLRDQIKHFNQSYVKPRTNATGEVANQELHLPGIMPKIPGRFYYLFGKAIETEGRKNELRNREKSQELYLEVKSEVEKCIDYLKYKREKDPYRSIFARMMYQAIHGAESQVPTFKL